MNKEKRAITLYVAILCAILIGCLTLTVFVVPSFFQESTRIVVMIMWIALTLICMPIENDHTRFKGKKEKCYYCDVNKICSILLNLKVWEILIWI